MAKDSAGGWPIHKRTNQSYTPSICHPPSCCSLSRKQNFSALIIQGPRCQATRDHPYSLELSKTIQISHPKLFTLSSLAFPLEIPKALAQIFHSFQLLLPDPNLALSPWPCGVCLLLLGKLWVTWNFPFNGTDLSTWSLSHLFKLRPRYSTVCRSNWHPRILRAKCALSFEHGVTENWEWAFQFQWQSLRLATLTIQEPHK